MTDSAPPGTPAATVRLANDAQRAARNVIAHTLRRTAPETSSAEAVQIARELELAVHAEVRARIRRVREAGESWAAVGALLGLGSVAVQGPGTLAEMAFDYAARSPGLAHLVSHPAGVLLGLPSLRSVHRRPRPGPWGPSPTKMATRTATLA